MLDYIASLECLVRRYQVCDSYIDDSIPLACIINSDYATSVIERFPTDGVSYRSPAGDPIQIGSSFASTPSPRASRTTTGDPPSAAMSSSPAPTPLPTGVSSLVTPYLQSLPGVSAVNSTTQVVSSLTVRSSTRMPFMPSLCASAAVQASSPVSLYDERFLIG